MTSVGLTRGWRLWRITSGSNPPQLVSPVVGGMPVEHTTLPDDGVLNSSCTAGHPSPHPHCDCGIYFFDDAQLMVQWAKRFGFIDQPKYALSYGTAQGRTLAGISHRIFGVPQFGASLRATSFHVSAILTIEDAKGLGCRYGVPVHWGPMTLANLFKVENSHMSCLRTTTTPDRCVGT